MAVVPNRPESTDMTHRPAVLASVSRHVLNLAAESISQNASHFSAVSVLMLQKTSALNSS